MTSLIKRIDEQTYRAPCWLWHDDLKRWQRLDPTNPIALSCRFYQHTHWHPDQQQAPTATPTDSAPATSEGNGADATKEAANEIADYITHRFPIPVVPKDAVNAFQAIIAGCLTPHPAELGEGKDDLRDAFEAFKKHQERNATMPNLPKASTDEAIAGEAANKLHPQYNDEWLKGWLENENSRFVPEQLAEFKDLHYKAGEERKRIAAIILRAIARSRSTSPEQEREAVTWYIPHPGTLEKMKCDSFEQAMKQWFEGFNLPVRCVNGKPEDFKLSYDRVELYHAEFAARRPSQQSEGGL